ncbi:hypothetical protein PS15m_012076 [Mucor circinelloides]
MFSLKQKWKALGQKNIVKPTQEDTANSVSVPNANVKSSSSQQPSIYQHSLNESFEADVEVIDGDVEQFRTFTNAPSLSVPSSSNHSAARQSPTKPIDIKYFVPKNVEPEGLSQSVMISDHDYIHRHLVQRYKMSEATGSILQRTSLCQETIQESDNEDLDYLPDGDEYNEEDSISVTAAAANTLFSKSVPLLSSMSNYPRFTWSAITPPDQQYGAKSGTHSPLFSIKEDLDSSESRALLHEEEIETSLDSDQGVKAEEAKPADEEDNLKEWTEAANERYGEITAKDKELFDSRLCAANLETPWDRAHKNEYALERLKSNEFIQILFKRHSVPIKVTNVAQSARFKQIQYRLHNPNILYAEYNKACKDEAKRKFRRKKSKAAKNGNRKKSKKSKGKNQKATVLESSTTKVNVKQQQASNKRRKKQNGSSNGGDNYSHPIPAYYYPFYYYQY